MGGTLGRVLAAEVPPTPVVQGDLPDPSVVRAADSYYGVATANSWAPVFRIIRSTDLNRWTLAGAVFPRPPKWAVDDFWAPDISKLGSGYSLLYSARLKRSRKKLYCMGIAFAAHPTGPWRDRGKPLRCGRYGSIDGTLTRDETGRLNVVFKEDGNAYDKPARLFAQRIAEDGRSLIGPARQLFRNTARWEGKVVEAATIVRRPDAFYMLYSGNLCCTRKCAYAIGVARSKTLVGRWEKFAGNPIVRKGNGWRCPGHTGLVDDDVLFHAYRAGAGGQITGRQILHAKLAWGADGWPRIGSGVPAAPTVSRGATPFIDELVRRAPEWEFPVRRIPRVAAGASGVRVQAPAKVGARLDAGILGRQLTGDRYTATVVVRRKDLRGKTQGGIASYRGASEAIGVAVARNGALTVWQRRKGAFKRLRMGRISGGANVTLRMIARGNSFRFAASADGRRWRSLGGALHGPIEESARLALTAGGVRGAVARFKTLRVVGG